MTHWETMWTFSTPNFSVSWQVTECQDLDLSWDDDGEALKGLQSGKYTCFDSRIVVYCNGEEVGSDYLGQSIYESPKDFRDHIGSRGKYGSCFTDMVHSAIKEARKHVRKIQSIHVRAA